MIKCYQPTLDELWFRESLMADPDTMSYNDAWGGTIPFPREDWEDWYQYWIGEPEGRRFYRYLLDEETNAFVGEIACHCDERRGIFLADVIIYAPCRGIGYGGRGLDLLCDAAKKNGIPALYDDIAVDNPAAALFLKHGFEEEYRTEEIIMLRKIL